MQLEALLLRYPLSRINRKADYVFSYGGNITAYIRKLGIPIQRIIEIPAAIEEEWMNATIKSQKERRFLFIGRYERRKGIEEINEVVESLTFSHKFSFSFVGAMPEDRRLSLSNVAYHGSIREREELKSILAESDVLVCPSYSEGMPNVILEGMANGCAAIATDVGAVSLLVNDENGWLIPAGDSNALREKMIEAIEMDAEALQRKRRAAYSLIKEKFLWPSVSKALIDKIEKIVSG